MTPSQIAVRLPKELLEAIDELVPSVHASRSEVIRRAIDVYLYRLACERDAARYDAVPLTDSELALADDRRAWQSAPEW